MLEVGSHCRSSFEILHIFSKFRFSLKEKYQYTDLIVFNSQNLCIEDRIKEYNTSQGSAVQEGYGRIGP